MDGAEEGQAVVHPALVAACQVGRLVEARVASSEGALDVVASLVVVLVDPVDLVGGVVVLDSGLVVVVHCEPAFCRPGSGFGVVAAVGAA